MTEENNAGKPHYKKRLRKGRLFFCLVLILALFGSCFAAGMRIYNRFFRTDPVAVQTEKEDHLSEEAFSERINLLLLGTDDGDSEDFDKNAPKRTDAMLLVSFDPARNRVSVLSLPRDTRVHIPGHSGYDKINAAYAYGGVKLAKQTVSNLLQVPIDLYMQVDWQGFIQEVAVLGGVDLDVEKNMNYEDPYADLEIHLNKGFQHLDGKKAGEYVRFRHDEMGDIGRVERQQKFLKALSKQAFTMGNMMKMPMLISTATRYVHTDMDFLSMVKAANCLRMFGENGVQSASLEGDFATIGGVSYWVTTRSKIGATLDELKIPHKRITED